ncbi:MAG: hypothetical protein IJZ54_04725 [Clostridia bacterium]|nr:hypothetical protein [Clostridia bacterium]
MFKLFSAMLEKMGNWFGIIFKIIIPVFIMFRPLKLTAFTIFMGGTMLGGDYTTFDGLGQIAFYVMYIIFILLCFLFPKVASAFEFVIIPYYFVSLIVLNVSDYLNLVYSGLGNALTSYERMAPVVALFLIAKIVFFIFLKTNGEKIEAAREAKFGDKDNSLY